MNTFKLSFLQTNFCDNPAPSNPLASLLREITEEGEKIRKEMKEEIMKNANIIAAKAIECLVGQVVNSADLLVDDLHEYVQYILISFYVLIDSHGIQKLVSRTETKVRDLLDWYMNKVGPRIWSAGKLVCVENLFKNWANDIEKNLVDGS